MSKNKTRI